MFKGLLQKGMSLPGRKAGNSLTAGRPLKTIHPEHVHLPVPESRYRLAVSEGSDVLLGQLLASPLSGADVPVFATVSGTILSIAPGPVPGGNALRITIRNNRRNSLAAHLPMPSRLGGRDLTRAYASADVRTLMDDAGLTVMDGSGRRLSTVFGSETESVPIRGLLIDACETEPYITCIYSQLRENAIQVITAARLLAHAAGGIPPLVCIPDDHPDTLRALRIAAEGTDVRMIPLRPLYPLSEDRALVRAALGIRLRPGASAADAGVLRIPAAAALALHEAARSGLPVLHRVITVSGRVGAPANVSVPIGTPVRELLAFCGGQADPADRLIAGGPMTGQTIADPDTPVTAPVSALLSLAVPEAEEHPCIRCGLCVRACPENLLPFRIEEEVQKPAGQPDLLHPERCTGCGACTYVCPAKRPLSERIRSARTVENVEVVS